MIETTLKLNRGNMFFLKISVVDGLLMNGGSSTSFSGSLLEELSLAIFRDVLLSFHVIFTIVHGTWID